MNLRRTPPSHDNVKAEVAAERMPGTATGKMMSVMGPKRVAPSMLAHSSCRQLLRDPAA
jgi:hypothetical protein